MFNKKKRISTWNLVYMTSNMDTTTINSVIESPLLIIHSVFVTYSFVCLRININQSNRIRSINQILIILSISYRKKKLKWMGRKTFFRNTNFGLDFSKIWKRWNSIRLIHIDRRKSSFFCLILWAFHRSSPSSPSSS